MKQNAKLASKEEDLMHKVSAADDTIKVRQSMLHVLAFAFVQSAVSRKQVLPAFYGCIMSACVYLPDSITSSPVT